MRRSIIVPDELWNTAMGKAKKEGRKLSMIIRKLLEMWVRGEVKPFSD